MICLRFLNVLLGIFYFTSHFTTFHRAPHANNGKNTLPRATLDRVSFPPERTGGETLAEKGLRYEGFETGSNLG